MSPKAATPTKRDTINGAMSIADDVAQGRVDPSDLEQQAVQELRELFGVVVGPDDAAWDVQVEVARGVLAAGGIPADELQEWLSCAKHRSALALGSAESDA